MKQVLIGLEFTDLTENVDLVSLTATSGERSFYSEFTDFSKDKCSNSVLESLVLYPRKTYIKTPKLTSVSNESRIVFSCLENWLKSLDRG